MLDPLSPPLVLMHRLRADIVEEVVRACERAGASAQWAESGAEPEHASLLVANLPAGERRIPDGVIALARRAPFPVLLLCEDPLARPMTTLQAGRITLLDTACPSERLYGRIRMLLCPAHTEPTRRERTHPLFWAGTLGGARDGLAEHPDGAQQEEGITAVVPFDDALDVERVTEEASAIAGEAGDDEARRYELISLLGDTAGVIHLSPEARDWILYWPARGNLWLFSTNRLPQLSRLSAPQGPPRLTRLSASSGDLALGVSGVLPPDAAPLERKPETPPSLHVRLADGGGPSVLDHVRELSASSAKVSASVVEVR